MRRDFPRVVLANDELTHVQSYDGHLFCAMWNGYGFGPNNPDPRIAGALPHPTHHVTCLRCMHNWVGYLGEV